MLRPALGNLDALMGLAAPQHPHPLAFSSALAARPKPQYHLPSACGTPGARPRRSRAGPVLVGFDAKLLPRIAPRPGPTSSEQARLARSFARKRGRGSRHCEVLPQPWQTHATADREKPTVDRGPERRLLASPLYFVRRGQEVVINAINLADRRGTRQRCCGLEYNFR